MGVSLRDLIKDEIEQEKQEAVEKATKELAEKAKEAVEQAKKEAEKAKEAAKKAKEAAEKEKETVINLSKEGMDIDFIVRVTKTAKEVVEQWLEMQEEDC